MTVRDHRGFPVSVLGGQQPATTPYVGSSDNRERLASPSVRVQGLVSQRPVYVWGKSATAALSSTEWLGQTTSTQLVPLVRGQYVVQAYDATDPDAKISIRQGGAGAGVVAAEEMGTSVGAVYDLAVGDVAEFTVTDDSNAFLTAISSSTTTTIRVRRVDSAER